MIRRVLRLLELLTVWPLLWVAVRADDVRLWAKRRLDTATDTRALTEGLAPMDRDIEALVDRALGEWAEPCGDAEPEPPPEPVVDRPVTTIPTLGELL